MFFFIVYRFVVHDAFFHYTSSFVLVSTSVLMNGGAHFLHKYRKLEFIFTYEVVHLECKVKTPRRSRTKYLCCQAFNYTLSQ